MVTLPMTECPLTTTKHPIFCICTTIHSFVTGEPRDFKFGTLTYHSKSHPADEKSSLKGMWSGSVDPQRLTLETSNFVHGSAMRSLSFVISGCSLSGRGQGPVSNFYIVDLENFATAIRRYTGDIHNSTVVGSFMTPSPAKTTTDSAEIKRD